jgi:F0F1-type ATP synthase gamma subunit
MEHMNKDYIKFIIAYDYGKIFESMELACDEAYELAEEIANRFLKHMEEVEADREYIKYSHYEILQEYCNSISFKDIWEEMN